MKTIKQWREGQSDFNQPGVPHYSPSDTPAIRGPNYDTGDETADLRYRTNRQNYQNLQGKRFRVKPGGFLAKKYGEGAEGIILTIGGRNFSYQMDNGGKGTYGVTSIPYVIDII